MSPQRTTNAKPPPVMSQVAKFWEAYFIKQRCILFLDQASYLSMRHENVQVPGYKISTYCGTTPESALEKLHLAELINAIGQPRLTTRLSHPETTLYLVTHMPSNSVAGFYWSLHPKEKPLWHDKIQIQPDQALNFNAFILPDHRRKGLYRALLWHTHSHLFDELNRDKVFTIVEAANTPSLQANLGFGCQMGGRNTLIKLLGRNIFSIVFSQGKLSIDYVWRNVKGYSL